MQSSGNLFIDSDYNLMDDDYIEQTDPNYNHARLKFSKELKPFSPWITPQRQFIKKSLAFRPFQEVLSKNRLKSTTSRQVKKKNMQKQLQVSQIQYKLKSTLVQFRVKSLSKTIKNFQFSPKKQPSSQKIQINIGPNSSPKKKSPAYAFFLEKSPKIKFLECKLKIKQSLNSISRRKYTSQLKSENQVDTLRVNKTVYVGQKKNIKNYELFELTITNEKEDIHHKSIQID